MILVFAAIIFFILVSIGLPWWLALGLLLLID